MSKDSPIRNGSTARGTVQLMLGRVLFMGGGYVIAVILARELGPAAYGIYGLLMSLLLWLEVTSDFGVQRATIKLVSQADNQRAVAQTAAATLLTVTTLVFVGCWIAAPIVAKHLNIENGAWLFRIAVLDIPLNGLYVAYQGILQGMRRFGTVAVAIVVYSMAKLGGIVLLLWLGMSVQAALIVNVAATIAALFYLMSRYWPGIRFSGGQVVRTLIKVSIPIGIFVMANRFVLSSHLWALQGSGTVEDEVVGFYAAAWNIAQLPTVVTFVLTGVVLASVSGALSKNDDALARRYVEAAGRLLLIVLAPMCVLGALDAGPIMVFIFSDAYADGGPFLAMLLCAYGIFAFVDTMMHSLLAAGEHYKVSVVQFLLIPFALGLNGLLIGRWDGTGAALALLCTLGLGAVVAISWASRHYGFPVAAGTIIRVAVATVLVAWLSSCWPAQGFAVVVKLACLVGVYGVILIATRELGAEDLRPLAVWKAA